MFTPEYEGDNPNCAFVRDTLKSRGLYEQVQREALRGLLPEIVLSTLTSRPATIGLVHE